MAKKLTKKQKAGKKAARTKKDKKLAAQARGLKSRGKRPDKAQSAALKRVEKKAKKKKTAGKKPKSAKRPKSGSKKPKSAKRPKSKKAKSKKPKAKKGAKKNPMSKAARSKAAKKAARTRKRNKAEGKRPKSKKPKSGKRPKKRASGSPQKVYEQTLLTQQRCERKIAKLKLEGDAAIGKERERKLKERVRLQEKAAAIQKKLDQARSEAAESKKNKGKRGKKGKRRNPVNPVNPVNPIEGWGQAFAAGSGAVVGVLALVGGDRFFAGHALSGTAPSFTDAPNQGAVYNVSAASLPLWANFKDTGWKRTLNAVGNVGLPLFIASKVEHEGGKTFFQLWGYLAAGLTIGKVVIDVAAKALGKSAFGLRVFSPETTAVSARAASLASQPAAVTVVQGQGFTPALTGYGKNRSRCCAKCNQPTCGGECLKGSQVASMSPGCPPAPQPQPSPPQPTPQPAPPQSMQPQPRDNGVGLQTKVVGSAGAPPAPVASVTSINVRSNDGPYTGRVARR